MNWTNAVSFIIGLFAGGTFGVVVVSLCVVAGESDKRMGIK